MEKEGDKESFHAFPSIVTQTSNYQVVSFEIHIAEAATGALIKVESAGIPGP